MIVFILSFIISLIPSLILFLWLRNHRKKRQRIPKSLQQSFKTGLIKHISHYSGIGYHRCFTGFYRVKGLASVALSGTVYLLCAGFQ